MSPGKLNVLLRSIPSLRTGVLSVESERVPMLIRLTVALSCPFLCRLSTTVFSLRSSPLSTLKNHWFCAVGWLEVFITSDLPKRIEARLPWTASTTSWQKNTMSSLLRIHCDWAYDKTRKAEWTVQTGACQRSTSVSGTVVYIGYCPGHAGVKRKDRADRLAGRAKQPLIDKRSRTERPLTPLNDVMNYDSHRSLW